jgi:1,4-dihydroxy-2-naphthoate polyprenyltransferase
LPGTFRRWWLAARPATLWAAVSPVLVGSALAFRAGCFELGTALVALAGGTFIQVGTNFANDLGDAQRGADDDRRVGPARAVAAGWVTPRAMWAATALAFGAAALCGVYLAWLAGWWVVAFGAASIASGLAYTLGPFPLGYRGLGDLFVLVFFGFVAVVGTAFVMCRAVPDLAWWAWIPVGCLATAILVVNNLRDRHTDAGAGKRTLAVRFGGGAARAEYVLLLAAAYATPVLLVVRGEGAFALLPLLSLPLAAPLLRRVAREEGPALNPALGGTGRLELVFSVLFAMGLVLGGRGA